LGLPGNIPCGVPFVKQSATRASLSFSFGSMANIVTGLVYKEMILLLLLQPFLTATSIVFCVVFGDIQHIFLTELINKLQPIGLSTKNLYHFSYSALENDDKI
jgi:hypothetical protein